VRGVSLIRAPKVVCLDTDDCLYPNALARDVSLLARHRATGVAYDERTCINEAKDLFALEWRVIFNKPPLANVLGSILPPVSLCTLHGLSASRVGAIRGVVRRLGLL
jgi:hypothetical protein